MFSQAGPITAEGAMTVNGTVTKTFILTALLMASATWVWNTLSAAASSGLVGPALFGGLIVGMIAAVVISFSTRTAPWLAPVYALAEGCVLGALSLMYEKQFHGIVMSAVLLTSGVLAAMLAAYSTGLIRATERFRTMVVAATGGIALTYLLSMVLGFFGIHIPGIFGNGLVGIVFSLAVVAIAAFNLVIDFDFIEQGAAQGAPKHMEWYGGFALLVTLVWLYMEILRLLSKLRSRD